MKNEGRGKEKINAKLRGRMRRNYEYLRFT